MRHFVVAANWKMNKSPSEAAQYLAAFLREYPTVGPGREVLFFVPAIDLTTVASALQQTKFGFGAENCHSEMSGAFTGENSPRVLAEIGTTHALVGHSERRQLFGETDQDTARKVKALHSAGLMPMLCVGETLSQRESGQTSEVISRQLQVGLSLRDPQKPIMVAYEPVWAIGTGRNATPEQAGEAHQTLRRVLGEIGGRALADDTPILYGGSVKPDNARDLAAQAEVDGFLVGGASLEISTFLPLVKVQI